MPKFAASAQVISGVTCTVWGWLVGNDTGGRTLSPAGPVWPCNATYSTRRMAWHAGCSQGKAGFMTCAHTLPTQPSTPDPVPKAQHSSAFVSVAADPP